MRVTAIVAAMVLVVGGVVRTPGFAAWQAQAPSVPRYAYTVVKVYPHDPTAFTQGLQYVGGVLYEGTGLNGRSSIRRVRLETGEVLQRRDVPPQHFGEGITLWGKELFQLTWKSQIAFVYDPVTFAPQRTLTYPGEGWGLTHDGTNLIMSDGSDSLRFLDPATFAERRRLKVTSNGTPVRDLNELEYVKGEIFANVWQTDLIVCIDPKTGRVTRQVELAGLLTPRERAVALSSGGVLNGIAYDAAGDRLFVTGKLWPKLFEIRLTPARAADDRTPRLTPAAFRVSGPRSAQ